MKTCDWPGCENESVVKMPSDLLNDNVLAPSPWPDGETHPICRDHMYRVPALYFPAVLPTSHATDEPPQGQGRLRGRNRCGGR